SGDVVVAVNGHPTRTFAAVHRLIGATHGGPVQVTVRRHGRIVALPRSHTVRSPGNGWIFGFTSRASISYPKYGVATSIRLAADDCWQAMKGTVQAIGGLFHKQDRGQLTSTVGI